MQMVHLDRLPLIVGQLAQRLGQVQQLLLTISLFAGRFARRRQPTTLFRWHMRLDA